MFFWPIFSGRYYWPQLPDRIRAYALHATRNVALVKPLALELMTRFADRQFRQLILDLQFFALQLVQSFLITVGMELFFFNFLVDRLVTALEFDDMTL
jgi:hypothetical protein